MKLISGQDEIPNYNHGGYELDTGPLLEHLEKDADEDPAEVAAAPGTLEAIRPSGLTDVGLILVVGLNLFKLILQVRRIQGLATNAGKGVQSLLMATLLDEPTWRFREKKETDAENEGPKPLDGDGKTVREGRVVGVGSLVDASSKKKTLIKPLDTNSNGIEYGKIIQ